MTDLSAELLAWYDVHARRLPWRVPPQERRAGILPDPYRVWLSEIMLQQTTVAAVIPYFAQFTEAWPTVADLAAAPDEEVMSAWAGLGYYARARNLLKCARAVAAGDGHFPDTEAGLMALPGIGPYTAAAVAAIAFDRQATVLDGNVERVMARLHAVEEPLPDSKEALRAHAALLTPAERPGDHAQAVMDLGATICSPRSPACGICPWRAPCRARAEGIAAELPRKRAKAAKPVRLGYIYLARARDGAVLVETRPEKGLLGGMLGLPGSDWSAAPEPAPPLAADWRQAGEVRHTFTHFHLRLAVLVAGVPEGGPGFRQVPARAFPTVMRKAYLAGLAALETA
ncbi:A/G-specific adenine glycosylase [Paroceanicella profunda]|uniref:Adenine DNA glycosylase n=1 Tax=Paroceanicella profunda TaxID=2579971 RepID=A0A5B8FUJ7_9RHOB|nr:A/G-specific adenine glycosylase [Paroceanicella profunda]QDL90894.1 A/G-specific adenine glycosylase [Paroceanicella profunda]